MKQAKIISLFIAVLMVIPSCSAGGASSSQSPTLFAEDGSYNWKPKELVDTLNRSIEAKQDSNYLQIPDYTASGEEIEIDWIYLDLILFENSAGYITKIILDWSTFDQTTERVNTCGLIIGNVMGSIAPGKTDALYDKLDFESEGSDKYTNTAEANGTVFTYKYAATGRYQTLTIEPTENNQDSSSNDATNTETSLLKHEIISLLDERLNKNGYPTLAMGLHRKLMQNYEDETLQYDLYIPSNGMYFYFVSNQESGELYQFIFKANNQEKLPQAGKLQGYIDVSLPYIFEPDNWEYLINQLGIGASAEQESSHVSLASMEYQYETNSEYSCFSASLVGKEPIDVETVDFENGSVTPQQIDWTIPEFVEKLDETANNSIPNLSESQATAVDATDMKGLSSDINSGIYYSLGSGVRMYLFASEEGRLEAVEFLTFLDSTTSDSLKRFVYTLTFSVEILDQTQATDILDTLQINDLSNENSRSAVGGKMSYWYNVDDDSLFCFISRISPMVSMSNNAAPEKNTDTTNFAENSEKKGNDAKLPAQKASPEPVATSSPTLSSAPTQQKTQPTPQPTQSTPQPSTSENNSVLQPVTPSPTPVPVDNPTFTAEISKEIKIENLIMLEGELSGISSPQDVSITCHYPNGTTYNRIIKNVENHGEVNDYIETGDGGLGSGSLTITLVSTGEVLAEYNFTVIS